MIYFNVVIYTYLNLHSEPISVIGLSLNDTCLKEGGNISVRCNIRGFPRPSFIIFYQNGIEITPEVGIFENILLEFDDQVCSYHYPSRTTPAPLPLPHQI